TWVAATRRGADSLHGHFSPNATLRITEKIGLHRVRNDRAIGEFMLGLHSRHGTKRNAGYHFSAAHSAKTKEFHAIAKWAKSTAVHRSRRRRRVCRRFLGPSCRRQQQPYARCTNPSRFASPVKIRHATTSSSLRSNAAPLTARLPPSARPDEDEPLAAVHLRQPENPH